jgi:hypothetical protein
LIGGLSEEMDGGVWCLKDYSRRALASGFLTWSVPAGVVWYQDDIQFGSELRRAEALKRSIALYHERWGEESVYCLYFPPGTDLSVVGQKFPTILTGARQGDQFHLLVRNGLYLDLERGGYTERHGNIRLHRLPRLMPERGAAKLLAEITATHASLMAVTGIDGLPFPGATTVLSFAELTQRVTSITTGRYNSDKADAICADS